MEKEREQKYTVIEEWFFPSPVYDLNGFIVPAPPEALQKYDEVNGDWLPKYEGEGSPCVSLFPVISFEKEGYCVQSSVYNRNMAEPPKEPEKTDENPYARKGPGYVPRELTPEEIEKMKKDADRIERELDNDIGTEGQSI